MKMQLIVLSAIMAISSARNLQGKVLGDTVASADPKSSNAGSSNPPLGSSKLAKNDTEEEKGSDSHSVDKSKDHVHTPGDGHDHTPGDGHDHSPTTSNTDTKDGSSSSGHSGTPASSAALISVQLAFSVAMGASILSAFL
ncbi:unnamed protein product [Albugo candida]|uniref:RxLR effector protein n=1 Tax=Albugo candida TaxID=65357 RepID=A0A024GIH3_9STRA|nr:unnamed protein product [Albugo candida]|eukprot:CCI46322.1 unnamed protein product [Albugo candida]